MLDDGDDIDLVLRFMVNKYQADRFDSEFMLLVMGVAVARVSTPMRIGPEKAKKQNWRND